MLMEKGSLRGVMPHTLLAGVAKDIHPNLNFWRSPRSSTLYVMLSPGRCDNVLVVGSAFLLG